MKTTLIGALVAGIILFLWNGLTQVFPWGVPSTNVLLSQSTDQSQLFMVDGVKQAPVNQWTTPEFDSEMVDKVNTLTTDATFSWIITKPLSYYNPTNYFLREIATQLLVGIVLAILAWLTRGLPLQVRLLIFLLAGLATAVSTYGSLFNWWGLTTTYAVGVAFNLIASWLIAGFIVCQFIIKSDIDSKGGSAQ